MLVSFEVIIQEIRLVAERFNQAVRGIADKFLNSAPICREHCRGDKVIGIVGGQDRDKNVFLAGEMVLETRLRLIKISGFRRHNEIILVQTVDSMRPPGNRHLPPLC